MPDAPEPTGPLLTLDDYCDAIGCTPLLRHTWHFYLPSREPRTYPEWEAACQLAEQVAIQDLEQREQGRQRWIRLVGRWRHLVAGTTPDEPAAAETLPEPKTALTPPPAEPAAQPRRRPKKGGAPPPPAAE